MKPLGSGQSWNLFLSLPLYRLSNHFSFVHFGASGCSCQNIRNNLLHSMAPSFSQQWPRSIRITVIETLKDSSSMYPTAGMSFHFRWSIGTTVVPMGFFVGSATGFPALVFWWTSKCLTWELDAVLATGFPVLVRSKFELCALSVPGCEMHSNPVLLETDRRSPTLNSTKVLVSQPRVHLLLVFLPVSTSSTWSEGC